LRLGRCERPQELAALGDDADVGTGYEESHLAVLVLDAQRRSSRPPRAALDGRWQLVFSGSATPVIAAVPATRIRPATTRPQSTSPRRFERHRRDSGRCLQPAVASRVAPKSATAKPARLRSWWAGPSGGYRLPVSSLLTGSLHPNLIRTSGLAGRLRPAADVHPAGDGP
jgi:hypothetical protein